MCGDFGEVSGIIDLLINFLAGGTLFLNSYDTLSYPRAIAANILFLEFHLQCLLCDLHELNELHFVTLMTRWRQKATVVTLWPVKLKKCLVLTKSGAGKCKEPDEGHGMNSLL